MTEKQRDTADSLSLQAIWQWLGVVLAHAAAGTRPPYIEPLLRDAEVFIHRDYTVTVRFADGSIIQVQLRPIDVIPTDGFSVPLFM